MVTKEEKREEIVDRIVQIREISAELQVELNKRGIEALTELIKDQVEDMSRNKIWEYLEV